MDPYGNKPQDFIRVSAVDQLDTEMNCFSMLYVSSAIFMCKQLQKKIDLPKEICMVSY